MLSLKSKIIYSAILASFSLLAVTATAEITTANPSNYSPLDYQQEALSHPLAEIASASKKPVTTKTETIYIEGEPQKITLYSYDESGVPFTTYIPENVNVESTCSDEGCGYFFEFTDLVKPELHIFLPNQDTTIADLEAMTQDLVKSNGWEIQGEYTDAETMTYPWVQKEIVFISKSDDVIGIILLGKMDNQVIRIVESFPGEFGDGFTPLADIIMKNLQFR